MNQYRKLLAQEAIVVGAATVPAFFVSSILTDNLNLKLSPTTKTAINAFLTGVLVHLTAEITTVNRWYLSHSAAALKKRNTWKRIKKNVDVSRNNSNRIISDLSLQLAQES